MGEQDVNQVLDERQQRAFMKALLDDLRALELMLEGDMIESGVRRHEFPERAPVEGRRLEEPHPPVTDARQHPALPDSTA
jgi:hypothetical protein